MVFPRTTRSTHRSWISAEIYFSIVQRKVVKPNGFTTLGAIAERLDAFEARYNQRGTPVRLDVRTRRSRQALSHWGQNCLTFPATTSTPTGHRLTTPAYHQR